MALVTALALPPLLIVALGAIQVQSIFSDRNKAQDVADAAALWGAQQLTVTPVGAADRTKAFATNQLGSMAQNATVTVEATKIGPTTMKVTVDTWRPSFFLNLLPFGGFYTHAESVAEGVAQVPLCVMTFGRKGSDKMHITGGGQMLAPTCLVHANGDINVAGSGLLQADTVQTSTRSSGPTNPSASTGAPVIADPFAEMQIGDSGLVGCVLGLVGGLTTTVSATLPMGSHCDDVVVKNGATLTLAPGEHYFQRKLEVLENANLVGKDVVLIFGPDASMKIKESGKVSLSGRESGAMSGFVITTTRNRSSSLLMDSDSITELTGAIYVPNAELEIQGGKRAAQASDWTVMTAKALKLTNKPQIQINANYGGSSVPVPAGVGNNRSASMAHLTQ